MGDPKNKGETTEIRIKFFILQIECFS